MGYLEITKVLPILKTLYYSSILELDYIMATSFSKVFNRLIDLIPC